MADAAPQYTVQPDRETSGEEESSPTHPKIASIIGIDIGTSRCSVALSNGYQMELLKVIEDTRDETRIRSQVTFIDDIPDEPNSRFDVHSIIPGSTIFSMKRLIGRMDTDRIVHASKKVPFLVQTLDLGCHPFIAAFVNKGWSFTTPERVLSLYLSELRKMAEKQLERPIRDAVVTFPVSFNRLQLRRLESACTEAGLRVLELMPEPTAVAMLYGQQQKQISHESMGSGGEKIALIFNMGAGYTDVAVVATNRGVTQIKALAGSTTGGEDLLQNMMLFLFPELERFSEILGKKDSEAINLSRDETKRAIHMLSETTCLPFSRRDVYRDDFERVNSHVFDECESLIIQCLQDAEVKVEDVNDVIVVGGCSCIPKVKNLVSNIFKGKQLYQDMDPLEAAVRGAASEAAMISAVINNQNPLGLSIIQVTTHTVGIRIQADENNFVTLIPRNTRIPARKDKVFTTIQDNQTEALIIVYEGEGNNVEENHLLGYFKIMEIPAAPKGVIEIVVSFEINAANTLTVHAAAKKLDSGEFANSPMEMKMPTVDDGHRLFTEALHRAIGSTLGLAYREKEDLPPSKKARFSCGSEDANS